MTRKDYLMISECIDTMLKSSKTHNLNAEDTLRDLSLLMSSYFKDDNARFNRALFVEACGFPITAAEIK